MKQVNKKPLIFYYLVAMGVLLLLNWLLFPSLLTQQIRRRRSTTPSW